MIYSMSVRQGELYCDYCPSMWLLPVHVVTAQQNFMLLKNTILVGGGGGSDGQVSATKGVFLA